MGGDRVERRYGVHSVFRTLQGEGVWAGAPAVFVRFTNCNAWDGHPLHRAQGLGACARWCDTDFLKGKPATRAGIVTQVCAAWGDSTDSRRVVLTGGEPMLQLDRELVVALQAEGFAVHVETNGSVPAAIDSLLLKVIDWLTVSPKIGMPLNAPTLCLADEVKVVLPGQVEAEGEGWTDDMLDGLTLAPAPGTAFYVMPMDPLAGPQLVGETALVRKGVLDAAVDERLRRRWRENVEACIALAMRDPRWRVGYQLHKVLDLP